MEQPDPVMEYTGPDVRVLGLYLLEGARKGHVVAGHRGDFLGVAFPWGPPGIACYPRGGQVHPTEGGTPGGGGGGLEDRTRPGQRGGALVPQSL